MGMLQSRRRRVWGKLLDGARGPGGWRTPPVPRSPRTGSGWRCEAVQRVRGTGSAPGEVKRRPRDLPAVALLAERPAAARVCGRRVWGGLENQGRGALFVGRLGEAWACAPDKGGRRNPRRGLGLCCARRGEGDGADRRAPLVSGRGRVCGLSGVRAVRERAGRAGWRGGGTGVGPGERKVVSRPAAGEGSGPCWRGGKRAVGEAGGLRREVPTCGSMASAARERARGTWKRAVRVSWLRPTGGQRG